MVRGLHHEWAGRGMGGGAGEGHGTQHPRGWTDEPSGRPHTEVQVEDLNVLELDGGTVVGSGRGGRGGSANTCVQATRVWKTGRGVGGRHGKPRDSQEDAHGRALSHSGRTGAESTGHHCGHHCDHHYGALDCLATIHTHLAMPRRCQPGEGQLPRKPTITP